MLGPGTLMGWARLEVLRLRMWGSELGLLGHTWVGKSRVRLSVWRMGLERLSVCLGGSRKLGEARGLEVGLSVGVWRGACVGVHWRRQGKRR